MASKDSLFGNGIPSKSERLTWYFLKHVLNLWPLWISSKCHEDIRISKCPAYGHGILIVLNHISRATCKRRWQNDSLPSSSSYCISTHNCITYISVQIRTQHCLILSNPAQSLFFYCRECINNVLLEQSTTNNKSICFTGPLLYPAICFMLNNYISSSI